MNQKDYTMQLVLGAVVIQALAYAVGSSKKITFKVVMGGALAAIFLSMLENVNTRIANGFAAMLLLGVAGENLIPLMNTLGLTKNGVITSGNSLKDATPGNGVKSIGNIKSNTIQQNDPIDTTDPAPAATPTTTTSTATPQNSKGTTSVSDLTGLATAATGVLTGTTGLAKALKQ